MQFEVLTKCVTGPQDGQSGVQLTTGDIVPIFLMPCLLISPVHVVIVDRPLTTTHRPLGRPGHNRRLKCINFLGRPYQKKRGLSTLECRELTGYRDTVA